MKLGKHWVAHTPRSDKPDEWVSVVNEIPAGSCCKYRLDKTTGQLELARALPHAVTFPTNYGFIPHTRCAVDDEETDVLIITAEPLLPLTIVKARVVGGFFETSSDKGEPEERLLAAAVNDANVAKVEALEEVDHELRKQIERFVHEYKQNQNVQVTFDGWFDRSTALERLHKAFKLAKKRAAK